MSAEEKTRGTTKFQFQTKSDAKIQQSVIRYLKSDAGKNIIAELVKDVKLTSTDLDKKTKDKIKKSIKVEIIPEVRDQFLQAVKDQIEDSAQSTEDNLQSQVVELVLIGLK